MQSANKLLIQHRDNSRDLAMPISDLAFMIKEDWNLWSALCLQMS